MLVWDLVKLISIAFRRARVARFVELFSEKRAKFKAAPDVFLVP